MKNILSIFIITTGILFMAGCRKSDSPQLPDGIVNVPIPLFELTEASDALIQEVSEFRGEFTVDLYFKDDVRPQKVDIYAAMNEDYTNVKLLQGDVTTLPYTKAVTGAQLADLFGIEMTDIVPGTKFEIRADMTLSSGQVIKGFRPNVTGQDGQPIVFAPFGSDIQNFPGSSPTLTIRAVCDLDLNQFVGNFTVDDPFFWEGSYPVTVTLEGEDVLVIKGYAETPEAVVRVKVDTKFQTAAIAKQVFAADLFGYTNAAVAGTGVVDACNTEISFTLTHTVDQGSFGTGPPKLIKR